MLALVCRRAAADAPSRSAGPPRCFSPVGHGRMHVPWPLTTGLCKARRGFLSDSKVAVVVAAAMILSISVGQTVPHLRALGRAARCAGTSNHRWRDGRARPEHARRGAPGLCAPHSRCFRVALADALVTDWAGLSMVEQGLQQIMAKCTLLRADTLGFRRALPRAADGSGRRQR